MHIYRRFSGLTNSDEFRPGSCPWSDYTDRLIQRTSGRHCWLGPEQTDGS